MARNTARSRARGQTANSGDPSQDEEADRRLAELCGRFVERVQDGDRRGARRLLRQAVAEGLDRSSLMRRVVSPAVDVVGGSWEEHQVSLSQVFVVGLIVKDSAEVLNVASARGEAPVGKVVIGTARGDYHGLGRAIVATLLRSAGFAVEDLGLSVTPEKFVEVALARDADIIAVSALMADTALRVREVREEMKKRKAEGIRLLVGGAPFRYNPDLCPLVGADATAANAYEAIRVAKALLGEEKWR